jgi:FemAB-related protein (PEP-CTERM system-associated)
VVSGREELLDDFYSVFARNMRDLGTPVHSKRLFMTVLAAFGERVVIHVVRLNGQPLAGGLSIRFRDDVLVPWASSLRAYRHLCPNMLLYWTMMERAVDGHVEHFDFGRSSRDSGTEAFKLQWGASARPLYWEYLLLAGRSAPDHGPDNPRFQAAVEIWKRLPCSLTNRVGPVIARHLP